MMVKHTDRLGIGKMQRDTLVDARTASFSSCRSIHPALES